MADAPMDEIQDALETALSLGDEGDWEGMAEHLRAELSRRGEDPSLLCWLGVAETELGMEGVAYERFRQALDLGPEDPAILTTIGSALARFDDLAAEGALRTAATLAPQSSIARASYGAYLSREGLTDDAQREIGAALAIDADDSWVQSEHGVVQALTGNTSGAVDAFSIAARLDPEDGWIRALVGLSLLEDGGRVEEAALELAAASELRPEDVELHLLAALAAGASGDLDEAERLLHVARLREPDDVSGAAIREAEDRIDEGGDAPGQLLLDTVGPSAYRERLMTRP